MTVAKKFQVDTPYENSWAHQEATRERVPISVEEMRQRRAGLVHPDIRSAKRLYEIQNPSPLG